MRIIALIFALTLSLAACETVPTSMDPVLFESELANVESDPNPASADASYTALLAQTLSDEQRASALYARGDKRLNTKFNLPGALEDFDAFLALAPDDPRTSTANRRKLFVAEEIEAAERRLAQLQNLSDWFDDKVLMGDVSAAAARYKTAGLTPNEGQFYLLQVGGYICGPSDTEDNQPVHRHGPEPDHVSGAVWCTDPSVS